MSSSQLHGIRPRTGYVIDEFERLRGQMKSLQNKSTGDTCYIYSISRRLISFFIHKLEDLYLAFEATVADLSDNSHREFEAANLDWSEIELAIQRRCDESYASYSHLLDHILDELRCVLCILGLSEEDLELHPLEAITSDPARWQRFLCALSTLGSPGDAALEIHFSRIKTANGRLKEIQGRAWTDPPPSFFHALRSLRVQVTEAAKILGSENGFLCQCPGEPHRAYLRIKQGLRPEDAKLGSEVWGSTCSVLFQNHDPDHSTWSRVDMDFELLHGPDTAGSQSIPPKRKLPTMTQGQPAVKKARVEVSFLSPSEQDPEQLAAWIHDDEHPEEGIPVSPLSIDTDIENGLCGFLSHVHLHGVNQVDLQHQITMWRTERRSRLRLRGSQDLARTFGDWNIPQQLQMQSAAYPLLTEEKLHLAYKVAFGFFYLYASPWLGDSWTTQDIHITRRPKGNAGMVYPLFVHAPSMLLSSPDHPSRPESETPRLPLTHVLGRFLVELSCGASWSHLERLFRIDSFKTNSRLDKDALVFKQLSSWVTDSTIASQDKPFYKEGPSYFAAIHNCFDCEFNPSQQGRITSQEDNGFALWLFKHVLSPLRLALEDYNMIQTQLYGPRLEISTHSRVDPSLEAKGCTTFEIYSNEDMTDRNKEKLADDWAYSWSRAQKVIRAFGRERPKSPSDRIRVAVLDTGVDITHDDLFARRNQIIYENFVGARCNIPRDDDGHGTHITSILLSMAENVDVYVARVAHNQRHFQCDAVEKAVRWAVEEKHVHIISISLGFPNADQDLEPIRQALLEANASSVLIFAAAGNAGEGCPIAFPACLDEVISVASTCGKFQPSVFNPDLRPGKRLCAIGEAFEAAWVDRGGPSSSAHCSMARKAGTSYATPVAAGIAAMVMDLVWSSREDPARKESVEYRWKTLRTRRGMLAVLKHMIWMKDNNVEAPQCLQPWMLFKEERWRTGNVVDFILDTLYNVYGEGSSRD